MTPIYLPVINYFSSTDFIIPVITIPMIDFLLCTLFTSQARWFQLHSAINAIIVYIISNDVFLLYTDPLNNIHETESKLECSYIVLLHIYHYFLFKNTMMDYFHHIVFVGFGCIPIFCFYNTNLIRLATFAGCGLPGAIEYFTLSLVKHKKLNSLTQKRLNSYMYNYFRFPATVYSISIIHIAYIMNLTPAAHIALVYYIIFIVFLNGSFYNKLTLDNHTEHKLLLKINNSNTKKN